MIYDEFILMIEKMAYYIVPCPQSLVVYSCHCAKKQQQKSIQISKSQITFYFVVSMNVKCEMTCSLGRCFFSTIRIIKNNPSGNDVSEL